jgi:hypothetical protein
VTPNSANGLVVAPAHDFKNCRELQRKHQFSRPPATVSDNKPTKKTTTSMNPSQEFSHLYSDVSNSIAAAMAEMADLKVEHKEGKKELSNIMERLRNIQTSFDGELDLLEQHAEWDKFTMAFFGETNAGKSTVIESLRILFKEESRQQLLEQNAQDLTKYEQALTSHVNQVREGLNKVYTQYAAEIVALKRSTAALAQVLQVESSGRIKRKLWLYALGGLCVGGAVAMSLTRLAGGLVT